MNKLKTAAISKATKTKPEQTQSTHSKKRRYEGNQVIPDWARDEYLKISKQMDSYFSTKGSKHG